ncbi:hypothetical protein MOMA_07481 [Moraxella macacae 0408225]|uniref:Corrinoid adenosyltransferase n=1 Tax=Moraxella macacae 0408225 TaxID=1230338 RepID=L2F5P1_9GAMM|nr:cob(I)yrinic acid a,c-diamide adenosyltransferase [Moraxella macacae]ELA08384.1 hypothetical protein MOMA_07481 [Moraxella macacae 0408225]
MGNRLSKIYTRTGDDGTTGIADGLRLSKSDLRFEAMGAIDRLNAQIGLLHALIDEKNTLNDKDNLINQLSIIQHKLFNIGGEIALPNHREIGYLAINSDDIGVLENWIDVYNDKLPYLKEFILPAGSVATANAHIARTLCRDAERVLIRLNERDGNINCETCQYMNRLSDFLFVLARVLVRADSGSEVLWQKNL